MFRSITDLLKQLVRLAQERNTYALASLNELRDLTHTSRKIERELDKQTELLTEIAAELKPPPPSAAAKLVITLGTAVPQ